MKLYGLKKSFSNKWKSLYNESLFGDVKRVGRGIQVMLSETKDTIGRFGKLELVDKEIPFIAFNRRDT